MLDVIAIAVIALLSLASIVILFRTLLYSIKTKDAEGIVACLSFLSLGVMLFMYCVKRFSNV